MLGDAPELVQVDNHLASLARRDCDWSQRRRGIRKYCLLLMTIIVNSRVGTRLFRELLSSVVSEIEGGLQRLVSAFPMRTSTDHLPYAPVLMMRWRELHRIRLPSLL